MIRRSVTINNSFYGVPSAEAMAQLQRDVVEAAWAGGGLVTLPSLGDLVIKVMITPHHSVAFEERYVPDDDYVVSGSGVELLAADGDQFSSFDY